MIVITNRDFLFSSAGDQTQGLMHVWSHLLLNKAGLTQREFSKVLKEDLLYIVS